jgi:uncharacterized protein (TIGR02757 family)
MKHGTRVAPARSRRIHRALDDLRARTDMQARLAADPVQFLHRFRDPGSQELIGLVGACIAFGNAKTIRARIDDIIDRLGDDGTSRALPGRGQSQKPGELDIARAVDDEARVHAQLRGWKHRVFRGEDVAKLLVGARRVQRADGSLGARFERELFERGTLREALAAFCDAIREEGGLRPSSTRRGPSHLLPDVHGASACKRLMLYLRWMVRPADGVDLGLWNVDPNLLLVPLDTHVHKLSRNLGFTRSRQATWVAAEEITAELRRFDARDPVKYDFALCHLGMAQRCPSRRDAKRCEGCGVKPVCRHWERDWER